MNCHAVQQLLSAERDQALGADLRGELETHLAGCAACRQLRATWAEAAESWRATTAGVRVPDAQMEWQRIRRRLNGEPEREAQPGRGIFTQWRVATLGAIAAAVAVGLFLAPAGMRGPQAPTAAMAAASVNTDSVEVGGEASSAMVFVDDKSGWLVVWAADATEKVGS
jgi:anti-sigma factor RsiW